MSATFNRPWVRIAPTAVLGVLVGSGITLAALAGSGATPARAVEASGCSGSATSYDAQGAPLDTASAATGEGATSDDPLQLPWAGSIAWEGTTDQVLQNGTWSADVGPRGAGPLYEYTLGLVLGQFLSGDFENADGTTSASGTVTPSDLTGTTRMVTGTYEVTWDVSAAAGGCAGTAYVKITDSPIGTVAWWTSIITIIIGIIGVILSRPPYLPPIGPVGTPPVAPPPPPAAPLPPFAPPPPAAAPPPPAAPPPVTPPPPAATPAPPPVTAAGPSTPPAPRVVPPPPPTPPAPMPPVPMAPAAAQTPQEPGSPARRRRVRRAAQRRGRRPVRGGIMGLILGFGIELMMILNSIPVPLGIAVLACMGLGILFGVWRRRRKDEADEAYPYPYPA